MDENQKLQWEKLATMLGGQPTVVDRAKESGQKFIEEGDEEFRRVDDLQNRAYLRGDREALKELSDKYAEAAPIAGEMKLIKKGGLTLREFIEKFGKNNYPGPLNFPDDVVPRGLNRHKLVRDPIIHDLEASRVNGEIHPVYEKHLDKPRATALDDIYEDPEIYPSGKKSKLSQDAANAVTKEMAPKMGEELIEQAVRDNMRFMNLPKDILHSNDPTKRYYKLQSTTKRKLAKEDPESLKKMLNEYNKKNK